MKFLLSMTMLLAALPSGAAAQTAGLCEDLQLLLRTMPEAGSFTAARPSPAFALFEQCRAHRIDFIDEVICSWRLPSAAPGVEALAGDVLRCLPGARRRDDPAGASGEARLVYELLDIIIGRETSPSGEPRARLIVSVPEG